MRPSENDREPCRSNIRRYVEPEIVIKEAGPAPPFDQRESSSDSTAAALQIDVIAILQGPL